MSKSVADSLEKFSKNISDSNNKLAQNIENSNSKLLESLLFSINAFATHLESIDEKVSEFAKMVMQKAIDLKINENSEYWQKIFSEMENIAKEFENQKKRIIKLESLLEESRNELEELQKNSNGDSEKLQTRISELENELESLRANQKKLLHEKDEKISELENEISRLNDEVKNCSKSVSNSEPILEETDRYKIFESTFLDKKTDLMWEKKNPENIEDEFTWKEVFSYAEKLNSQNYGGYSNWRVPTRDELKTLLTEYYGEHDYNYWDSWFDKHKNKRNNERFLDNEISQFLPYHSWSSDIGKDNNSGSWVVNFDDGYDSWRYQTGDRFAVCVRDL
ncbi:membrane-bound metallopeptidase [Thiovulum sp. ES]|nr:membrane-bound metallopeptidase [Thiovulum sp. ES]